VELSGMSSEDEIVLVICWTRSDRWNRVSQRLAPVPSDPQNTHQALMLALGPGGEVIPQSVMTKAPTTEPAPGSAGSRLLPEYEELDAMLNGLVEEERSVDDIARDARREDVEPQLRPRTAVRDHESIPRTMTRRAVSPSLEDADRFDVRRDA